MPRDDMNTKAAIAVGRIRVHRRPRTLLACALVAFVVFFEARASDVVLVGTVTRVVDGDTIDVQLQSGPIRVRLDSVDAPETSQPYGVNSKAALAALVEHKVVDLQPIEQDRYERMVAVVWLEGLNVNEELVRAGMAWAFRRYLRDAIYCEAEENARQQGIGLWAAGHAEVAAPWEWRARQRGQLKEFTDLSSWSMSECIENMGQGRR